MVSIFQIAIKKTTFRNLCLISLCFLLLGFFGYWQAAAACFLFVLCVLPAWLLSRRSHLLSVKVFLSTVTLTVGVSLILFYLLPEDYQFQYHRPFYFTAMESAPVSGKLGLLLVLFVVSARMFENLISTSISYELPLVSPASQALPDSGRYIPSRSRSVFFQFAIFLIIALAIPLNVWMFNRGIGITGLEPTEVLPFKLNGILTYTAKLVIPAVISSLYSYTRRCSFSFVLLLSFYAIFLGVATASRAAAFLVMLMPLIFAWIDRRHMILLAALLATGCGIVLTTEARTFLYVIQDNVSSLNDSYGVLGSITESFRLLEADFLVSLLNIFPVFLSRIESFPLLFMSSRFDAGAVGGSWLIFLKFLDWRLADLGHDAVHLEFLGYTVPESFYNATGTVASYAFWASNKSLWVMPFFAFLSAFILVTLERSTHRIFQKYNLMSFLSGPFIFSITVFYYAGPGSMLMNSIWFSLMLFAVAPRMTGLALAFRMIGLTNHSIVDARRSCGWNR